MVRASLLNPTPCGWLPVAFQHRVRISVAALACSIAGCPEGSVVNPPSLPDACAFGNAPCNEPPDATLDTADDAQTGSPGATDSGERDALGDADTDAVVDAPEARAGDVDPQVDGDGDVEGGAAVDADDAARADAGDSPTCSIGSDCPSGFCNLKTRACVATPCEDGEQNGSETDVDCGGGVCPRCAGGKVCSLGTDCVNAICGADHTCATPTCQDQVQNGTESDVDCGGGCVRCNVARRCAAHTDCKTGNCFRSLCTLATGPPHWLPGWGLPQGHYCIAAAFMTSSNPRGTLVSIGHDATYQTLDTQSMTWSKGSVPGPANLGDSAATGADGRVYIVNRHPPTAATYSFDGTWTTTLAPISGWRSYFELVRGSDDLIYAVGGALLGGQTPGIVQAYDRSLDRWTPIAPIPTGRQMFALGAVGRRIYAAGGISTIAEPPSVDPMTVVLSNVEAYDVTTRTWSRVADLPYPTDWPTGAGGSDGRFYVIGGRAPNNTGMNVNVYDPLADRWTPIAPLTFFRSGASATVGPDGRIYVLGGLTTDKDTVEIYGPVVALSRANAAPGDAVVLTGRNFAADSAVSIHWGAATGNPFKSGATNARGELAPPITFVVPVVAAGEHTLTIVDDRSQYPVTAFLKVD